MPRLNSAGKFSGRVLVTGATGFLGRAVADALESAGHHVLRGTRLVGERARDRHTWVRYGEIGPQTSWDDALDGVATVVHLAGLAHLPDEQTQSAAEAFKRVNAEGTTALAKAAAAKGVRRFVLMSSVLVHGNASRVRPFTEGDKERPETAYAQSKLDAELGLKAVAGDAGMEWVILRPPMVYGSGARGNFRRLVGLVATGLPLPLGCATAPRRFIGIDNLASAAVEAVTHPGAADQTFLIGDAETTSTAGLIRLIADALDRHVSLLPVPAAFLRMAFRLLGKERDAARLFDPLEVDIGHIRAQLDWVPPVSLAEGVRRAVASEG
ncbi:MAG: NAD-dependent epimerase/dehydratase family protein [Hyphomicrobiaceae bacterium]|nr:MAG: NAD-dependent epimerase/dehydratase family protein [Hyphomicrobiaceae bacterium]